MPEVISLTKKLIKLPSITPNDHGCLDLIVDYIQPLGFKTKFYNKSEVKNLWAVFDNTNNTDINNIKQKNIPLIAFAGHTDVVPTGPLDKWDHPPFEPVIKDNLLYGRGAADMKGSLAAMLIGIKNYINNNKNTPSKIALLLTSDEEGPAIHGTRYVVEQLLKHQQKIDYCIVGEPSSREYLGDVIKNGRRGSLTASLTLYGTQGHVAYPHKANNAIHMSLSFLQELTNTTWDNGNQDFPATSMQIVDIEAGTGASNIIPGTLKLNFNFRYSTESNYDILTTKVENILNKHKLEYKLSWQHYAKPFLTEKCAFTKLVTESVEKITNKPCQLATDGGTSDGRFIYPAFKTPLIELGPKNHCIHKTNEHVDIDDLDNLAKIYEEILNSLFKAT